MTDEEAWEKSKEAVGIQIHEEIRTELRRLGTLDHPFQAHHAYWCTCGAHETLHNPNMVPWAYLSDEAKEQSYRFGRIGFMAGRSWTP